MKVIQIRTLAVFATLMALSGSAHAYTAFQTCNGVIKWSGFPYLYYDDCTIPLGGTVAAALANGVGNWGTNYNQRIVGPFDHTFNCSLTYGDDFNEVMLVSQQTLGSGLNALTTCEWGTCFFSAATFNECDIISLNTLSYSPEDESFWNWSNSQQGPVVLAHELGHFIGLGHSQSFDIMRADTPYPIAGGNTSEPYPDDAAGARWLYGNVTKTNVFSSAQQFVNSQVVATNSSGTVNVCRGNVISVTATVVNPGTTVVSGVGFRIYLGTSPSDTIGAADMFDGTATSNPTNWFTQTFQLTVPNVSNGTYWIIWQDDTSNSVSETIEFDNRVHSAMTIAVIC
jgi:hypothetical protein